jgi:ribosomal protein L40E
MNSTSSDLSSVFLEISVPSSIVKDLDFLSLNLKKMFAGQSADIDVFTAGLVRIMEWSKVRPPAENNSVSAAWTARYVGLPEVGGTLICQNTEQELMLSLDSENVVYMGSWRSLQPGQEEHGGIFSIEDSSSGRMLVLDTGLTKQQFQLPDSEGLTWGSVAGFLQRIQVEKPTQLEAAESHPLPPAPVQGLPGLPSSPNIPDVESPPKMPAKPAKRQIPPAPLPSINVGRKPAPAEQPAVIDPKIWKCACGSKNTGQFCPKCGSEKPAPVVEQKRATVQPTVCRQCGGMLSIGARFCRNCGTEVRG